MTTRSDGESDSGPPNVVWRLSRLSRAAWDRPIPSRSRHVMIRSSYES
jgi:hypothetical protein